jgi:Fic family protein
MKLPKRGPPVTDLLKRVCERAPDILLRAAEPAIRPIIERANNESWNWEDCGYHLSRTGLTQEELWLLVKLARGQDRQEVPLQDAHGKPFSFRLPREAHRILHLIDTHLGGSLESAFPQLDTRDDRQRYLINSLTEEAIASSQIEGAAVTRDIAKEMLRTNRRPRSPDEWMILNNYKTIQMLNGCRHERLDEPLLHRIQASLTEHTLDDPTAQGRFRRADENITVWDNETNQPVHYPPPAGQLPERVARLCEFANGPASADKAAFIHPAVRAIILHFWLGFDHPYVDGNGRTARALFYWSMLRSGYWLVEYLTISAIIRGQPKQYARAYLNTERDDNDLTYFILYHLKVIERSLEAFRAYLDRKLAERQRNARVLLPALFNSRQQALLLKAVREPQTRFTYESHANSHGASLVTARADLLSLEELGLLRGNRKGRRFEFVAVPDLDERLERLRVRESG